jgi:hypothetical protein
MDIIDNLITDNLIISLAKYPEFIKYNNKYFFKHGKTRAHSVIIHILMLSHLSHDIAVVIIADQRVVEVGALLDNAKIGGTAPPCPLVGFALAP